MIFATHRALLRSLHRFAASCFLEAERSCTKCQNANFTVVPAQLQSKQHVPGQDTAWHGWIGAGMSVLSHAMAKDRGLEIFTQAPTACRGHFDCSANDQSSTGQSRGESLQATHDCSLGCASTGHTVGLQDPPRNVTPPGQPAATQTGNRGGEASTSAAGPSLAEPTGNDHTAKWKIYTNLAKKLVAQVPSQLSCYSACGACAMTVKLHQQQQLWC